MCTKLRKNVHFQKHKINSRFVEICVAKRVAFYEAFFLFEKKESMKNCRIMIGDVFFAVLHKLFIIKVLW